MAKAKRVTTKVKKKVWYPILAPRMFNNQIIGDIPLREAEKAEGRYVSVNLMTLTNDIKTQNITMRFLITGIKEGKAQTEVEGYKISPTSLKKMVRRSGDKIDHSFTAESKDGKKTRIKFILVTTKKAANSTMTDLRKRAEIELKKQLKKMNYADFMREVVIHKLQRDYKKKLSDIFRIKTFELKAINLVK